MIPDSLSGMLATTLWQSSLLCVLVAWATWWLRDASPRLRHGLWLLVLARLLVPVAPVMEASLDHDTWAWSTNPLVLAAFDDESQGTSAPASPASRPADGRVVMAAPSPTSLSAWFATSWLLGALVLSACAVLQSWRLRRLCTGSRQPPAAWSRRLTACLEQTRLTRRVALRVADVAAPITVGLLSPTILVPDGLDEQLADDQRDAVLVHELVHIERRDLLVHALATLTRIVFFFHPVAWWTARRLEHERELVADRESVRRTGTSARRYGETLLAVARFAASRPAGTTHTPRGAPAMTRGGRALADRIGRLGRPLAQGGTWVSGPVVVVALGLVVLACHSPADAANGAESTAADLSAYLQEACRERSIELPRAATGLPLAAREVRGVALVTETDTVVHRHLAQGGWLPVSRPLPRMLVLFAEPAEGVGARAESLPERYELELDRSGLRWNGQRVANLDAVWAELDPAPSRQVLLAADPTLPFGEVAVVVNEIIQQGHSELIYVGVPTSPARRADLKQQLQTLPETEHGELLVLTDRRATWARHLEVIQAAASIGLARVSFVALDDQGQLVRVPQDLPADVGVLSPR